MAKKLTPVTEQYQHFVRDLKESFWGDLYRGGQQALKQLLEAESERERQRYLMRDAYERKQDTQDYRNGSHERDVVTRLGTIRFRVARTRQRAFLPKAVKRLQRRAEDVAILIREAFLRGISTRQVGRVIGVITGEVVSAQTVWKISRSLDGMVKEFHQARLSDDWVYLFLDGVSLRVRRAGASGCRCWWPMEWVLTGGGCWDFNVAWARASKLGKGCWGICTGVAWKAGN